MKKPQLSALPTELIQAISGHLELKDLLVLCCTSHQMHAICVGWIYRVISLQSPVQLLKCCQTILSRKEAADAIREIKIVSYVYPKYALKGFYSTFESAIMRMKNLRTLKLRVFELFKPLSHISFPRLFDCMLPMSLDIFPFLRNNSSITSVMLSPALEGAFGLDSFPIDISPIHMPKLQCFIGSRIVACSVVPGSLVSRVGVLWTEQGVMESPRDLAAIATSKSDIVELSCATSNSRWDPALLVAIAKHTPRIRQLSIRNMDYGSPPRRWREDFLSVFDHTIRSLPCLEHLIIVEAVDLPRRPPGIDRVDEELDSEFESVRKWGETSPELKRVTLSSVTTWERFRGNVWFPGNPIKVCPGTVRCCKWIINKVLDSPDLLTDYRLLAYYVEGYKEMSALKEAVKRDGVVPAFDILVKEDGETVISSV
ncbi:hypothetical protein B0H19DRAFT_1158907 [Mycena capillaripes]|nr:hypothetical protein B0H19DRAFT_1158907 [Mycena capillaripes]